jgi:hypothetical protein
MSQWLVTANDSQFAVEGLGDLKQLAKEGKITAGDMVQRPGASDWVYAGEISELADFLESGADPDTDEFGSKKSSVMGMVIGVVLLLVAVLGGGAIFTMAPKLDNSSNGIFDELSYSEMLVTEAGAPLHKAPDGSSAVVGNLEKDSKIALLSKRRGFYRTRSTNGIEGWVAANKVIPAYQIAGGEVREEMDPLFNPERYVEVANARWSQLPDQRKDQITVFQFLLRNRAQYVMSDLIILATVKDANGSVLETIEISIEGEIPADSSTWVGTLAAEDKAGPKRLLTKRAMENMDEANPELEVQLRYSDGVEVQMTSVEFTDASIDILELRAIPG